MSKLNNLKSVLVEKIVPAKAMGIDVVSWKDDCLTLKAPLKENINDKGIAFGGSIYSLAVLCGWGTVFQVLDDAGFSADVAVYKSECNFMIPTTGEMKAVCFINPAEKMKLIDSVLMKGRGRAFLTVEVFSDGAKVSSFSASYAVRPKNSIGQK